MKFIIKLLSLNLFLFFNFAKCNVLVITDSHGEKSFGDELIKQLEKKEQNVNFYAVGGSQPKDWLNNLPKNYGYFEYHTGETPIRFIKPITPNISYLIQRHQPNHIFIELGTNMIWEEFNTNNIVHDIKMLLKKVQFLKVKNCTWIGPPDLDLRDFKYISRFEMVKKTLSEEVPKNSCSLIKSWTFTKYPKGNGDGIHYDSIIENNKGELLARKWASSLISFLKNL